MFSSENDPHAHDLQVIRQKLINEARIGNWAEVRQLLYEGCYPDATALFVAAKAGFTQVVELLLDAGADVNFSGTDGEVSALMVAAEAGHGDVIQILLAGPGRVPART